MNKEAYSVALARSQNIRCAQTEVEQINMLDRQDKSFKQEYVMKKQAATEQSNPRFATQNRRDCLVFQLHVRDSGCFRVTGSS